MAPNLAPGAHHISAREKGYRDPALLDFVQQLIGREDAKLRKIREETPQKGLPPISIGPEEGQILALLIGAMGARRIVEIGTLAGYSACWMARAMPEGGILHTLEYSQYHAEVARKNISSLGLSKQIMIHEGPALENLPALESEGPFDFCFIDADKINYPQYLRWAAKNLRSGGLAVGDNAYLFGKLHLRPETAGDNAPAIEAMREFLKMMADPKLFLSCAMIPTGEGMAVAVKK